MKSAGVHIDLIQTYHSLRHGYKDYLRSMKIDIRTIDLQVGHALDSVSKSYGLKSLRPDEIVRLQRCPFWKGAAGAKDRTRGPGERRIDMERGAGNRVHRWLG
jgi:hypothetical protein